MTKSNENMNWENINWALKIKKYNTWTIRAYIQRENWCANFLYN